MEQQQRKLVRLERVREMTGMSRTLIYTDPTFPDPVPLSGRAVAWVEGEVEDWIQAKISGPRTRPESKKQKEKSTTGQGA